MLRGVPPSRSKATWALRNGLGGLCSFNSYLPSDAAPPPPAQTGASKRSTTGAGGGASPGGAGSGGGGGAPKADTISYEIKFIIVSSGNVTPTWKLVRVSANSGSTPFFSTGRTRTHDLIVTIGPNTIQTNDTNLASQISSGVGSANRALLTGN